MTGRIGGQEGIDREAGMVMTRRSILRSCLFWRRSVGLASASCCSQSH